MLIYVDIDDTICYYSDKVDHDRDYSTAIPYTERINKINRLYDNGDTIVYWTARGTLTQKMWFNTTYKQLTQWGCKFHELRMGKPVYDLFIDDKNISSDNYF
jgi:hypothetical protein